MTFGLDRLRGQWRSLWGGLVLLHLCILILTTIAILQSRAEAYHNARQVVANLSNAVAQNLKSLVEKTDWGMLEVVGDYQNRLQSGDLKRDQIVRMLQSQDLRNPDILGFHIYDAQGRLAYAANGVTNPHADVSQRAYFQQMRDNPGLGLLITPPAMGLSTQQVNIGFIRRINNPDGSFAGLVRASMSVQHVGDHYRWFPIGLHGASLVYDQDHVMVLRLPVPPEGVLGNPSVISPTARGIIDRRETEAMFDTVSPVDGHAKIASMRKLGDYPLYALVTYAEEDYLEQWRHDSQILGLFAFLFMLLSALAVRQVAHKMAEGRAVAQALADSNLRYDLLVRNIPFGVFTLKISDEDGPVFTYVSPRFLALMQLDETVLLKDFTHFQAAFPPDQRSVFVTMLRDLSKSLAPVCWRGHLLAGGSLRVMRIEATPMLQKDGAEAGRVVVWNGMLADITEQDQAEHRMRELDEKLRGLYQLSPLGIALTSPEGRFVEFNESFRKILGYSDVQLKELDYWAVTPQKYRREEDLQLGRLSNCGYYGPYRKEYIDRNGRLVPVQLNGVRITGADGRHYTWSIVEDVSERLKSDEELRLSLERFRLMTSGLKDYAIYLLDEDGRIATWSEGAQRLKHYGADEVIGQTMDRFFPPEDVALGKPAQFLMRAMAQGTVEEQGWRLKRDGSRFWADATLSCIRGEDGQVAGYVKIVRDITERKLAEDNMRLTAVLFEKSLEAIMVTDQNRAILEVNEAFIKLTGFSRAEVLGRNPRFLKSGHHDDAFYKAIWESVERTGHWIGELWNRRKSGESYPQLLSISAITNNRGEVTNYLSIATDLSRLKNQERQLERIAHYDSLTGIANRVLLADRMDHALSQAKRNQSIVGICYLDLDGFKPINDEFGHQIGDKLLIEVSRRILMTVRGTDTVARLGGDEFVVLLVELNRVEECTLILEKLLTAIAQPIEIEGRSFSVTASIGVSIYHGGAADADADTLLRHADKAMFVAKDEGRNRSHFYDPTQDVQTREHFQYLQRLREALEAGEFVLYYQPKVDMLKNQVVGAEALIRWQHPERGLVPPLEFLPILENTDLEVAVGEWVIDQALAQLSQWHAQGLELEISINISASHLQSRHFVPKLASRLKDYPDLPPRRLEIEVLETAALQDLGQATDIIGQCRELGVTFALDDFGTGYSSLTYLRRIPAETLKIDQTFVRDMLVDQGDHAIVDGIIVLAKAFDLRVVAEGVETTDHYLALVRMGCQIGQGFGIARPMPPQAFLEWQRGLDETNRPGFAP